jgi:hypothetical protein
MSARCIGTLRKLSHPLKWAGALQQSGAVRGFEAPVTSRRIGWPQQFHWKYLGPWMGLVPVKD